MINIGQRITNKMVSARRVIGILDDMDAIDPRQIGKR